MIDKTIIVRKGDACENRYTALNFSCAPNLDLNVAVRSAVQYFLTTDVGQMTYIRNKEHFTWNDFVTHLTNPICRKFGFEFLGSTDVTGFVAVDEDLVIKEEVIKAIHESTKEDNNGNH